MEPLSPTVLSPRVPAPSLPPLRRKLLVTVNAVLGALLFLLLFVNFRRELAHALTDVRAELREEAISVFEAVQALRDMQGAGAIQRYIDRVADRMDGEGLPRHEITVRWKQQTFRARSPATDVDAAESHADVAVEQTRPSIKDPVVGSFGDGQLSVEISESGKRVWTALGRDLVWELFGSISIALLAAVIVNVVLAKSVMQPLDRLVELAGRVASGDLRVRAGPADSRELMILSDAVNSMIADLEQNAVDRRAQMARAKEIQEHLLPHERSVPGLAVSYLFRPADDVAGDYFDLLALPDGTWLLCLADVAGHGVPAALGAAIQKVLLRAAAERHSAPGEILAWINTEFMATWLPDHCVTMFLARWHPNSCKLEYASAGHETGLQRTTVQELIELPSTGMPIGTIADAIWETCEVDFDPGDALLLVSDGITEARNPTDELFGRERLRQLFQECRDLSAPQAVEQIQRQLSEFRGQALIEDDMTLAIMQCIGELHGTTTRFADQADEHS